MSTYKLLWIVGGAVKEELFRNETKTRCKWKAKQLKLTTHSIGKIIVVPNDLTITKLQWNS